MSCYRLEKHFAYVIEISEVREWVTAFRYDIAVRANVMCHHVNGCVADPSVQRPRFLEVAKAKTETFKDGWIRQHNNPYKKGGERERFNPLTGIRYEKGQSHDCNDPDLDVPQQSTLDIPKPRDAYSGRRGRGAYRGDRGGWKGKGKKSTSPYERVPNQNPSASTSTSKEKSK